MKKILVLLLVLAVAGGVFAQEGTWSLSGGVRVGTTADFKASPVTIGAGVDGGWNNRGNLNVGYKRGNLSTSIGFQIEQTGAATEMSNGISLSADYDAGNYRAKAATNFSKFLGFATPFVNIDSITAPDYKALISELWGYYKMLGGLVHLEGAYVGRDNGWWGSNATYGGGWANLNGQSGLLANVDINNLQFGIMVPGIFAKGTVNLVDGDSSALRTSVVGFKFVMAPVEFAAQFRFLQYGVYFGAKYTAGPVVVGLNFKGLMDGGDIGVGASADYESPGLFGAGVAFKYQLRTAKWMEVNPSFWYNVIPDYFYFKTELGFHFEGGDITWKLTPQIAWNFLGNGAKGYGDLNTGIGARFNLVSSQTSTLWVGFKWGF
jgi:hypothetical protein